MFNGTFSKDLVKSFTKGYSSHCEGKKNKVLSQAGNWQKETKQESLISFEHGRRYLKSSQRLASIFFQAVTKQLQKKAKLFSVEILFQLNTTSTDGG